MLGITSINRNHRGEIVNIELSDGRRISLEELFQEVKEKVDLALSRGGWGLYCY